MSQIKQTLSRVIVCQETKPTAADLQKDPAATIVTETITINFQHDGDTEITRNRVFCTDTDLDTDHLTSKLDFSHDITHGSDGNVSVATMIGRALRLVERYPDQRAAVEDALFQAIKEHAPAVNSRLYKIAISGDGS